MFAHITCKITYKYPFICFLFFFFFEGIFIYPLEEGSVVVGFEAMISTQIITLQIKDKTKIEDCYVDCCKTTDGNLPSGKGGILYFAFKTALKCCCVLTSSRTFLALLLFECSLKSEIMQRMCKYFICSHKPSQSDGLEQGYYILMNINDKDER